MRSKRLIEDAINIITILSQRNYSDIFESEREQKFFWLLMIETLRFQQRMKPEIYNEDENLFSCPLCGASIGTERQSVGNTYCCSCGQALDWSDWKDKQVTENNNLGD